MTPFRILVKRSTERRPVRAWVVGQRCGVFTYVEDVPGQPPPPKDSYGPDGAVRISNEGVTWCREWIGEAAEAFKVTVALS